MRDGTGGVPVGQTTDARRHESDTGHTAGGEGEKKCVTHCGHGSKHGPASPAPGTGGQGELVCKERDAGSGAPNPC